MSSPGVHGQAQQRDHKQVNGKTSIECFTLASEKYQLRNEHILFKGGKKSIKGQIVLADQCWTKDI